MRKLIKRLQWILIFKVDRTIRTFFRIFLFLLYYYRKYFLFYNLYINNYNTHVSILIDTWYIFNGTTKSHLYKTDYNINPNIVNEI